MSENDVMQEVQEKSAPAPTTEELQELDKNTNELDHMLPEDLAGRIIRLSPWTPIFRFTYPIDDNGGTFTIDLNAFGGNVTCKLPQRLPTAVYADILASLKIGTIMLTDKEEKDAEPFIERVEYTLKRDQQTIEARIFMSELSFETFKENLKSVTSSEFLARCLEVESIEKRRSNFIAALRQRMKEVS